MFIVVTDHEVVGSLTLPTSFVSILSTGLYIYTLMDGIAIKQQMEWHDYIF